MSLARARRWKAPPDYFLDYISSLHLSHNIYACLVDRSLVHSLTAIPLTQDPEAVRYIIDEMRRIPDLVRNRQHTPFIHVEWLRANSHKYLDLAVAATTEDRSCSDLFREILDQSLDLDLETVPLLELVTVLQALMLFLIRHAFADRPEKLNGPVRPGFTLLAKGCAILWSSGFQRMPHDLTPWQTWILAESVRRTILMSYLVQGTYSAWTAGWCTHRLFVYALPFSMQGRLWLADNEEEWTTALTSGQNTTAGGTSTPAMLELRSFKEFTLEFTRTPFEPGGDLFQRLLLVSHHGKKSVEERLARITRRGDKPLVTVMSFGASGAVGAKG
ncbi:hypothetical protein, variant [Phialophora macrospora]|uniref:Transcription factor domain-containing protein n=1 Tax=Phialophora macrospora TaxID=1851006 RepID=A0A0D2FMS2_9EURO|nr:hypothetical protein, variant [Phialophora macrospora]